MYICSLFANEKHILDMLVNDADHAGDQLKELGKTFTEFSGLQVVIDRTNPYDIKMDVITVKGMAAKVEFSLVKQ